MSGSAAAVMTKPAFRKVQWLERDIDVERRGDGTVVLKVAHSAAALREAYPGLAGEMGKGSTRAHLAGAAERSEP
ncbi:hypothetical protein ACVIHB_008899 [Bradyrhizobium liaoningense]